MAAFFKTLCCFLHVAERNLDSANSWCVIKLVHWPWVKHAFPFNFFLGGRGAYFSPSLHRTESLWGHSRWPSLWIPRLPGNPVSITTSTPACNWEGTSQHLSQFNTVQLAFFLFIIHFNTIPSIHALKFKVASILLTLHLTLAYFSSRCIFLHDLNYPSNIQLRAQFIKLYIIIFKLLFNLGIHFSIPFSSIWTKCWAYGYGRLMTRDAENWDT
jgi:hypothetical protein